MPSLQANAPCAGAICKLDWKKLDHNKWRNECFQDVANELKPQPRLRIRGQKISWP